MKKIITLASILLFAFFICGCKDEGDTNTKDHDCLEYKSEWLVLDTVSCGEEEKQQIICTKCSEVLDEKTITKEHEYESVVTPATCLVDGEIEYTCKLCSDLYTEKIPSTGHVYEEQVIVEVTCDTNGEIKYTCKHCDDSYTETVESIGHEYEETVISIKTCDVDGEIKYTCKHCSDSYTEKEKATGHDYEKTVLSEATCTEKGEIKYTCKNCDDSYIEESKTKEHDYRSRVMVEKTCTVDGETRYTCKNCDDSYVEIDEADGHKKDEGTVILNPSGSTPGIIQYNCKKCGEFLREETFYNNPYQQNGKLSVNGRDLVNQNGEKFQLYGLSTHGLQWFSKVVNEGTLSAIAENFGNNIFRFALYTDEDGYCDGSEAVKKRMLETLEKGIEIATELGLYVIVDWHMVGAENVLDKNPLTYLEEAKEFFSYISNKYKDQDNILYEIMNEPNGSTTWADCKKYANEVIPCIRKNTDAIILVGNPKWTADLNSVMKDPLTGYTNIMYTYHFYAADHTDTSQVVKAYDSGFPVFISEFGFMESSGDGAISTTYGNKWKQVLDSRNISYVAWNISNSKGSASIFKYNTSNLTDVSDSNLKEWGVYLKNWYSSKSSNNSGGSNDNNNDNSGYDQTITKVDFDFSVELTSDEWTNNGAPYYACFIQTTGYDDSRLKYDWTSTNEAVLSINEYSTITIYGNGKCSIICRTKTGDKVAVVDVEVKNGTITYVSRYK